LPISNAGLVGDRQPAFAHVREQVPEAGLQALALERELQHLRIGRGEVGRAHRIDELARVEAQPLLGGLVS